MVKLTVLYGPPTDPDAFDAYYFSTHLPLARKIPGVRQVEVSKCASLDRSTSPFHLIAELSFDDADAMGAGLRSEEGAAAAADVANFATGTVTMLRADVVSGS